MNCIYGVIFGIGALLVELEVGFWKTYFILFYRPFKNIEKNESNCPDSLLTKGSPLSKAVYPKSC